MSRIPISLTTNPQRSDGVQITFKDGEDTAYRIGNFKIEQFKDQNGYFMVHRLQRKERALQEISSDSLLRNGKTRPIHLTELKDSADQKNFFKLFAGSIATLTYIQKETGEKIETRFQISNFSDGNDYMQSRNLDNNEMYNIFDSRYYTPPYVTVVFDNNPFAVAPSSYVGASSSCVGASSSYVGIFPSNSGI